MPAAARVGAWTTNVAAHDGVEDVASVGQTPLAVRVVCLGIGASACQPREFSLEAASIVQQQCSGVHLEACERHGLLCNNARIACAHSSMCHEQCIVWPHPVINRSTMPATATLHV